VKAADKLTRGVMSDGHDSNRWSGADETAASGQPATGRHPLEWVGLIAVLLCAAGLRLWGIEQNGYGNLYYAAAVRSMLQDGVNFFFGSFDPAGFVTLDKPPVAVWIQAASAWVFGYSGLSLLVPQALMGVASVLVLYLLVRRVAGPGAALLAGMILALTPVSVAVDRDNLPDTALVLVLLLAAWAWTRAVQTGRLRPLLVAAALVGVGFNVKMLAAFVVLPAFYLAYLVGAPGRWRARLGRLAVATPVLAAVSLSWSLAVELTPENRRPYIGGSKTNSAFELALGYNGLGRIFGGSGNFGPRGGRRARGAGDGRPFPPDDRGGGLLPGPTGPGLPAGRAGGAGDGGPPAGFGPGFPPGRRGPVGGPPPGGFGGPPGWWRFAGARMAGQITWLFPLALIGAVAAASRARWRPPDQTLVALILWGGWLVTHWVVFSWARGIFHDYYTTVMGPALAALAGIGVAVLWQEWLRGGWRAALLPGALLLTAAWQAFVVSQFPDVRVWLLPTLLGGVGVATAGILGARWFARLPQAPVLGRFAGGVGLAALLAGPACWSVACLLRPSNAVMPAADPMVFTGEPGRGRFGPPFFRAKPRRTAKLVEFLRANRRGERFLVAAQGSMAVAPLIIATGEPAVALGGFAGADPVVTREEFVRMVNEGQLRFVLGGPRFQGPRGGRAAPGGPGPLPGLPFGPPGGASPPGGMPGGLENFQIMEWVRTHGKEVDPRLWRTEEADRDTRPAAAGGRRRFPGSWGRMERLYDCRPELGLIKPKAAAAR
jgi:4-amino-4-deoxy-L-arabinose transferase-like glycosyltransferase